MPIRRKDDLLGRMLRIAMQSACNAAATDEAKHAAAIIRNRILTTDHLQSGRIPRREMQRIEQEVEEATADAMCRLAELRHGQPDIDEDEALYRACNWASLRWSLLRRMTAAEREAVAEHNRHVTGATIDGWFEDSDESDE